MGIAYEALLNWSLFGRTTFDLGAGRNISYSYQDTEPYYLLTNVRLLVTQPLPGRFELYGGYDWEHMAYRWRRGVDATPGDSDRVDRLSAVNGGVGIRLGGTFTEGGRGKDAPPIDRRSAAEFQAHEDLDHRDGGFVRK